MDLGGIPFFYFCEAKLQTAIIQAVLYAETQSIKIQT